MTVSNYESPSRNPRIDLELQQHLDDLERCENRCFTWCYFIPLCSLMAGFLSLGAYRIVCDMDISPTCAALSHLFENLI